MRLNVKALWMASGILLWAGMLLVGILATYFDYGVAMVEVLSSVYAGFTTTPMGILKWTLRGLVDGFIAWAILGWLYNCFVAMCPNCKKWEEKMK